MSSQPETIVARATPPGIGGISVVRISGPKVPDIAHRMLGRLPTPRYAQRVRFLDDQGQTLDSGLALFFPAPHSFTGEDVLELHGHGGPVVVDMLIKRVVEIGARMAGPGEFSQRAFINDKLDLVQAEAIADLINSASEGAARSALRSLSGVFSARIGEIFEELVTLRAFIEASLDFPEDDIDELSHGRIVPRLVSLREKTARLSLQSKQGQLLRDGLRVVLLGPPNAGKSSLFNQLARADRAIVSPHPGTTRDTIECTIEIDGMPVHLVDTAGLHESEDALEQEGMRRSLHAAGHADLALFVIDSSEPGASRQPEALADGPPCLTVCNKIDLTGEASGSHDGAAGTIWVSVKLDTGMDDVRDYIKTFASRNESGGDVHIARRRHLIALESVEHGLRAAISAIEARTLELAAEDLRQAQHSLGEITGEFTSEDLLGRIFREFCIGK